MKICIFQDLQRFLPPGGASADDAEGRDDGAERDHGAGEDLGSSGWDLHGEIAMGRNRQLGFRENPI